MAERSLARKVSKPRVSPADLLAIVGFMALVSGVGVVSTPGWALVVGGGLLLSIGIFSAWRRS